MSVVPAVLVVLIHWSDAESVIIRTYRAVRGARGRGEEGSKGVGNNLDLQSSQLRTSHNLITFLHILSDYCTVGIKVAY